ncbi:peptidyl-prolyl cis-trans isomerase C [Rhodobium orientis]|uniref:Parvulin-like PPIase n=1 Tax=Rhodobium orientis TaxID=34017 RepID=A0A327JIB1_9HYPH|nr:nitrogen fixation protein NifM [Rhodobium orientis]MBB4304413.1 peptidyl-prolyl cis-trans isomerase C [Rhodobium orientis]MBK5952019.1 nitrogen fixation protein NifM [Rhodobium orientis]RAI25795.1 nitrogen fixation protein NifM [Rhodobium orientis]
MTGVLAHHLMRAALARYGKRYDQLDGAEQRRADADARHAMRVEALVLESAEAAGVVIPERSLTQTCEEVAARYESPEALAADLAANGLTPADLRTALERELMVETVLEKVASMTPEASEAEIRAWYDAHPMKFQAPETRTVRHILVTINDDIPENRRAAARARIDALKVDLSGVTPEDLGARFADLALRHSECPSALEGGRLGRVPAGKLYPEIDRVLFALAEGSVGDVVETEAGFHIVYCEIVHPAGQVPFAEVRDKIAEAMMKKRREKTQTNWMAALLKGAAPERAKSKADLEVLGRTV